jgi:ssDNA-binding Zn-finger/Zn-ribbon topoisomerase 1
MGDFADDAVDRELDEWLTDMEEDLYESNTGREFVDSFPYGRKQKVYGEGPCPKCGEETVLRSGPYGKFYGCSDFPNCRGTREFKF